MIATLLTEARQAGLDVRLVDDRLRVRGPQSAAPLVEQLRREAAQAIKHLRDTETETLASAAEAEVSLPGLWNSPCPTATASLGWLGDWAMLLDVDDLPERLRLSPGEVVVDRSKYLAWLHADIRRGLDGPRARTGALQQELQALWSVLLGRAEAKS